MFDEGTMGRRDDGTEGIPVRFACRIEGEMNLAGVGERWSDGETE